VPRWIESGDPSSPVWLIGEAPGREEVEQGRPFVGASGRELDTMLREAGWPPTTPLFRTNICHERPPSYQRKGKWVHNDIDQFFAGKQQAGREGLLPLNSRYPRRPILEGLERLSRLIAENRPLLLILCGGSPLWGLCGKEGVTKWRGSVLEAGEDFALIKCLVTLHPSIIVDPTKGQYTYRPIIIQDLRRALREASYPEIRKPQWLFHTSPSLRDVKEYLSAFIASPRPLTADTEGWGVVDCIGIASSSREAMCIPFVKGSTSSENYWSIEDELTVFDLLVEVLRKCLTTWHNFTWDAQVIGKNWHFLPLLGDDTMVAQHVAFPGLLGGKIDPVTGQVDKRGSSLSLSFCSSMFCDHHCYWKDDGRLRGEEYDDVTFWRYNCEDCVRTFEVRQNLVERVLPAANLTEQYRFLISLFRPVLKMMFRGFNVDHQQAAALRRTISTARREQQEWLDYVLGHPLNVHSTAAGGEMQTLLYQDLQLQPVKSRKTGATSTDDEALDTIARRTPVLTPLVRHIQNIRSLDTNEANFIRPILGGWGGKKYTPPCGPRLRTCLNIAGAETFRFTSNETAFAEGLNLQNLTRPED